MGETRERERTWRPNKQAVHSAADAQPPQPNGFKSLRAVQQTGGGTSKLVCPAPSSCGWHSTLLPWRRSGLGPSLPLKSEGAGISALRAVRMLRAETSLRTIPHPPRNGPCKQLRCYSNCLVYCAGAELVVFSLSDPER